MVEFVYYRLSVAFWLAWMANLNPAKDAADSDLGSAILDAESAVLDATTSMADGMCGIWDAENCRLSEVISLFNRDSTKDIVAKQSVEDRSWLKKKIEGAKNEFVSDINEVKDLLSSFEQNTQEALSSLDQSTQEALVNQTKEIKEFVTGVEASITAKIDVSDGLGASKRSQPCQ